MKISFHACSLPLIWLWGTSIMMMQPRQAFTAAEDVCLLLYQMADNNLEVFIREDLTELTNSRVLQEDETMTTWVYFDHRNYGTPDEDIVDPIENVFNSDGSVVTGAKPEGSQYMRFDHSLNKMVIDRQLEGEQNGDASQTVSDFLTVGLNDCVSKGSTSFLIVFSSHGGGYSGFGGDENTGRRSLAQGNDSIVQAIQMAINAVPGSPAKIDVIGFDACLMQALGAADEYSDIANYVLASEAIEPGHGWAYSALTDSSSALNLAKNMQETFLSEKQGSFHDAPKTLSIIESEAYIDFLSSWNALSASLKESIEGGDTKLLKKISRARNQAVSFENSLDEPGTKRTSGVDIGSFLILLEDQCKPSDASELRGVLDTTLEKYQNMFVVQGVGIGTKPATGMHVGWPVKTEYLEYADYYDSVLFDTSLPDATNEAPDWLAFLKAFYYTRSTVGLDRVMSVCSTTDGESGQQGLLISPTMSSAEESDSYTIQATVADEVDWAIVEFGIFMSTTGRRLKEMAPQSSKPRHDSFSDRTPHRGSHRRHLQSGDDYLTVFGGDVAVGFGETTMSALWDRQFYKLGDSITDESDFAYTFDDGSGTRSMAVLYFEPGSSVTTDTLNEGYGLSEADFIERYGGQPSSLTFNILQADENGVVVSGDGLSLYTDNGFTYHEVPLRAGGSISPVLFVHGQNNGTAFDTIVGGLNSMLTPWQEDSGIFVSIVNTDDVFQTENLVVVDVVGYDDDATAKDQGNVGVGVDAVSFFIEADGTIFVNDAAAPSSDSGTTTIFSGQYLMVETVVLSLMMTMIGGIF